MKITNMNDLRTVLCEQMERVHLQAPSAANCNAITNSAGKVISSIKLEIQMAKDAGVPLKEHGFLKLSERVNGTLKKTTDKVRIATKSAA